MTNYWETRAEQRVWNHTVQFLREMENEYDRDQMCDCVGKLMVPTGRYRVIVRDLRESDAATPVLFLDTTKEFGNQIFRNVRGMRTDEQILNYIAYLAYNILKNGSDFFKPYHDKYSGYYDGKVASKVALEEMEPIIKNHPVQTLIEEVK